MDTSQLNEYERKVLAEAPGDYVSDHELVQCGKCHFCGTRSKMGYWMTHKETGKRLLVGTSCVYTLSHFDKHQARVFKALAARQVHNAKYAKIKAYLVEKHKDELVSTYDLFHKRHDSHYEVLDHDENFVYYKWVSNKTKETLCTSKMRVVDWERQRNTYNANYDYGIQQTPKNVAAVILNKIETTRSTIHKFWFETYQQLTGVDLKEVTKDGKTN